ncbi:Maintenance of ploidy protein mob2 [Malassezia obtusa]|uniref:Maintenance of ploidy protein mob2 n=1 Tax=Malassezia obtusa TaxID=76774 RepID=A0AAF0IXF7_9BASI|nr:Maintenance of ploidy protein mob2 [Malassezia obtusa]
MARNGRQKRRGVPGYDTDPQGGLAESMNDTHLAAQKPLYLCQPFVRSALIKGSFRTIVALPKYVHPYEWIAMNLFDFFHGLNQFCGVTTESCTVHNCPTMSAGVGLHYTWVDVNRKRIHLPAPQYIDFVMTWIGQLLNDEAVFPTKSGREFPASFPTTARQVYKQMLRIFAHIYDAHFPLLLHLSCEGHVNSLFAHFIAFGKEFDLFDFREFKGNGEPALGAPACIGGIGGPDHPATESLEVRDIQAALIGPTGERQPYPGVCDLIERWVERGVLPKEVLQ